MFETLLTCLDYKPLYYPFYDELIFSSKAVQRETALEDRIKTTPDFSGSRLNYLLGLIQYSKDNFNQALNYFSEAAKYDSANNCILYQLSYTYRNLGNYENANSVLQKAIRLNSGDPWFGVKAIIARGSLFYLSNKPDLAKKLYRAGYDYALTIGDKYDLAMSIIDLGILMDENGDVDNARINYKNAENIANEIKDQEVKALSLSELGVSFSFTNNLVETKQNYIASYKIYRETGNTNRLSLLAGNIGQVYIRMSNYESALNYFLEGLQYSGDNKRSMALNMLGLADVYTNISNYSKALNYYREVQKISSQIKDISLSGDALSDLGSLNYNIGNFNNAYKYFSSASEISNSSTNSLFKADIFNKLGLTYLQLDSLDKASSYLKQSINISGNNRDYYTEALSASDLADFYLEKGNLNEAEKFLSLAGQSAQKSGTKYLAAVVEMLSGKLAAKKNEYNKSRVALNKALTLAKELNERDIQIETYYLLAKLSENAKWENQADLYYNSAIKLIEDISFNLYEKDDIQISYFTSKEKVYEAYIDYLLNGKRFSEAFDIVDRSRSRNTMQSLTNLKLEELIGNKQTLDQLYDYNWLINSGLYDKAKTDSITSQYENLKLKLISEQPELRQYLEFSNAPNLELIQQNLNKEEYIISIYSAQDKEYAFLISKNSFIPYTFNISLKELTEQIKAISPYYNPGNNGQDYYNKDLFSFNSLGAYNLYSSVLKPVFDNVPENSNVVISNSPELTQVPFDFLIRSYNKNGSPYNYNDKDFLIYHYNLSYTPSAAVYLKQKENNLTNNGKVLLVGDPEVNKLLNNYADRRGLLEDLDGLNRNIPLLPLKYSGGEVSNISDIITADKILTGGNATESNFKESAPLSKIIHLSTHSFIFNKQPVIFFSNSYNSADDGFLETSEIVKLKLNSDMVVLSSCNSGKGLVDRSEGVLGMTKAFFEAGAKSVVVSLWEVDDKYTADLMSLFYKRLSEGYDKSRALRYAKIDFIKRYSSNPYYWSAFILSGNISDMQLRKKISAIPYLTGILLIIGMALLIILLKSKYYNQRAI
jgi:CHAT domain-containing protein/Flp pilus assembly protein TadD